MVDGETGRGSHACARRAVWVGAAVLLLAAGAVPFVRKGMRGPSELPVYTTAAERIADRAEVYRTSDPKPFTYPPFFALPFLVVPGAPPVDPPRPAGPYVVWYLVNAAALVVILVLVHRRLRIASLGLGSALAFWAITALLAARHVSSVFENHSHDLLVFLLVMLGIDALCRSRGANAGIWIGVAAACKATPLLFGFPWLLQRRFGALLALAAACAAATLLPDVLFARADGRLWVVAYYETFLTGVRPGHTASEPGAWHAASILNQSMSGTLHRLLTPSPADPSSFVVDVAVIDAGPGLRTAVTLLASLLVLALIAAAAWPRANLRVAPDARAERRFGEAGAVLCGMVLLSPMSSKSHFCVLLVPIAFCALRLLSGRGGLGLGLSLLALLLLGPLTVKGIVGRELGMRLLACGTVTWTALIALVATVVALSADKDRGA